MHKETSPSTPRRSRMLALAPLALVLPVAGAFVLERPVLEKMLAELVMPLGLIWMFVLGIGAWTYMRAGWNASRSWFFLSAVIWLCGSEYLVTAGFTRLERRHTTIRPFETGRFDAVVVLGGGASVASNGISQLSMSGDRLMLAVRMYQNGQAERIVCTGSRIAALDRSGKDPQDVGTEILASAGIPATVIEQVDGINTYQEVRSLTDYFEPEERVGVITSAWHMSRVERLAADTGFVFVPLPSDFMSPAKHRFHALDWIPDARSLFRCQLLLREYLAAIVGR